MNKICIDIISNIVIAILLGFGSITEWKNGNKIISILTGFVSLVMIWKAIEGIKDLNKITN